MKQLYTLLLLLISILGYSQTVTITNTTIEEGGVNIAITYFNTQGISILDQSYQIDENNITIDICFQEENTFAFVERTVNVLVPFQGDLNNFTVNVKAFYLTYEEVSNCDNAVLIDEDTYYASLDALFDKSWYLRSLSELEDLGNLMDYSDALQVEFSADNYISVDSTCNSGGGEFQYVDSNSFFVSAVNFTLRSCLLPDEIDPDGRIEGGLTYFWNSGTYTFDIEDNTEERILIITKDDGSTATYVRPKNNIDQLVENKWYPIHIEEELPPENYNGYIDFSINDGSFQLNTFLGQECGECRTELQNMTTSTFEHFQSNTSCEDLGTSCHAYDSILFYLFDTSLLSNDNLINYEYSIINDQEFSTLNITNKLEEIVGVFTNNPNRLSISSFNITKTPYIYPTVINGNSNIQFNDAVTSSSIIEVYDIVGRLINTSSKENFSPNVKALNSGVYFISIIQNGALLKTEKIILQ